MDKESTTKTFGEIMEKRKKLMNECEEEGVATAKHYMHGVYGMLWGVGHEDAPGLAQPKEIWELCKRSDAIINRWGPVSKLFDYKNHKELYKRCYSFVKDLHRVAQGIASLDDLKW